MQPKTYNEQGEAVVTPGSDELKSFSVLKNTVPAPQPGQRNPLEESILDVHRLQVHLNNQPASLSCRTETQEIKQQWNCANSLTIG